MNTSTGVGVGTLTPTQLAKARLRHAYELLAEVAGDCDLLPPIARAHVVQALAALCLAKVLVGEVQP